MNGKLTVVGTGMTAISQLTREAEHCLFNAEKVFYLVTDPHSEAYIKQLNATAECLQDHYAQGTGKPRLWAYQDMVEAILTPVRKGATVCAAFYGHPGVFVYPSHEAIVQARKEGHEAKMLPGISAEDMMIADLGFDPALPGLQTYEATGFVLLKPNVDPRIPLVLWQVGVIGVLTAEPTAPRENLEAIMTLLMQTYPTRHNVIAYQASAYDNVAPVLHVFPLCELPSQNINSLSTLYVPPAMHADPDPDRAQMLGVRLADLSLSHRKATCRIPGQAYGITYPERPGWVTGLALPNEKTAIEVESTSPNGA